MMWFIEQGVMGALVLTLSGMVIVLLRDLRHAHDRIAALERPRPATPSGAPLMLPAMEANTVSPVIELPAPADDDDSEVNAALRPMSPRLEDALARLR